MKFLEIKLKNFRQFLGEQSARLDTTSTQPVAMFFGANGSGKTTLLNAFTWCLYGDMSEDVEQQSRLATDSLWESTPIGSQVETSVELTFEHESSTYIARRVSRVMKDSDSQRVGDSKLSLRRIDSGGASNEEPAAQEIVDTILPKGLSAFFFFNGERIEKLTHKTSYTEIRDDIKALLGLEQVERALLDLPKVDRKLGSDLRKYGGEQAAALQLEIDNHQAALEDSRRRLDAAQTNRAGLRGEREDVLEELRKHEGVADLQRDYDNAKADLDDARIQLEKSTREKTELLATRGFTAFTEALCLQTAAMATSLYERGALPAPLKRDFVDQLIDEGECICGTELVEGGAPWGRVRDWRARAGLAEVEAGWQRLEGQVGELQKSRAELIVRLQAATSRIDDAQAKVHRGEERLAQLDTQLKGSPMTDVKVLATKRMDLDGLIDEATTKVALAERDRDSAIEQIGKLESEQKKAAVTDALAQKSQKRLDLVRSVKGALEEILEIRSNDMRDRLDAKVKKVFAAITTKPFEPELSTDFELKLYQATSQGRLSVPKSTGENQILSLSFVAAVSELAREVKKERAEAGESKEDWGTYPIVMDAAFGSLDENYQEEVSRVLANMAPQLVVLVSKSQGLGTVLSVLESKVNRMGVVVTHSSNTVHDPEEIVLEGRTYPYVMTKEDSNWSELKAVR